MPETLIVTHRAGQFSGEATMITGRRPMARVHAVAAGEVIELTREQLLALVQTDAELSEILMRAFMLRRIELIAHDLGDVVVLGSTHCAGTLARAGVPDSERPPVPLHRPRSRRRGAGDARSLSGHRGGRAGPDLPRRRRAAESEQRADRRVPRLQRCRRSEPRERSGDRRRRSGGTRRCRLRRVGRARCARPRIGLARRPGGIELQDRELPRLSNRHLRTRPHRPRLRAGAEVRRADHDRQRRDRAGLRSAAVRRAD